MQANLKALKDVDHPFSTFFQLSMNLPNLLTLSRVPFLFLIALLMFLDFRFADTLAFVVFVVAGLTDWLDGKIAREMGIISVFGQLMDALTDKILTVGLFVLFVGLGILDGWWLFGVLLILSREFLITGLRMVAAAKNVVLPAEKAGKLKTVFQICAIGGLILGRATETDWSPYVSGNLEGLETFFNYAGLGMFTLATLMTVYSGSFYMIKYWNLFFGTGKPEEST